MGLFQHVPWLVLLRVLPALDGHLAPGSGKSLAS
jgi:hypothetical protein